MMKKTRQSLFYLVGYLSIGGIGFLIIPQLTLELFLSNGNYSDVMVRMLGVFMLGLAIVVFQIIRHEVTVLYKTTLMVRAVLLSALLSFFIFYKDPFFIVWFIIAGIGFIFTLISYIRELRNNKK